jgi:hypothetical protein
VCPAADLLRSIVGEAEGLLGATARSFIGVP